MATPNPQLRSPGMPKDTAKIGSARAAAIYRALRHAIGERFGVSRTLVRHAPGQLAADLIVLPCRSGTDAVAEIARPVLGLKNGRRSFTNVPGLLHAP